MASSYPISKITVYYKRFEGGSVYTVESGKKNITSTGITGNAPYIEETMTDGSGTNVDTWLYNGRYTIGGTVYDMWENRDGSDTDYFTNVIVDDSGIAFKEVGEDGLVAIEYTGSDELVLEVFDRDSDNYVFLPCPSSYVGNSSTLVSSARNSVGVVIGDIVREDVSKVELTWNYLTLRQYAAISRLFSSTYGGSYFVKVKFFDATANGWIERIMYPNDRAFETAPITLVENIPVGFTNVSLHLIDTCREVS